MPQRDIIDPPNKNFPALVKTTVITIPLATITAVSKALVPSPDTYFGIDLQRKPI